MKNIFKLSLLITLSLFTFSCSNDDDSNNDNNNEDLPISERIVASWRLTDHLINGESIGVEVCELQTEITFYEDLTLDFEVFLGDEIDDCESNSTTGTWEFIEANEFSLFLTAVNQDIILQFELKNNDNKLIITNPADNTSEVFAKN